MDVTGILFLQKGYRVNIISSHDVEGHLTQPDGSHVHLKIKVSFIVEGNQLLIYFTQYGA